MSPVINATELLKCRQQVTRTVPQPSLRAVCRQLLEYEGPRGLLCGYTACLPRNILGNATMFGLFDLLRAASSRGAHDGEKPVLYGRDIATIVSCSLLAGAVSWVVVFPIDVVKSNIQVTVDPRHRQSFQAALRQLVGQGWGAAYRGLGPTLLRSIPTNTVFLPTFVLCNDFVFAS